MKAGHSDELVSHIMTKPDQKIGCPERDIKRIIQAILPPALLAQLYALRRTYTTTTVKTCLEQKQVRRQTMRRYINYPTYSAEFTRNSANDNASVNISPLGRR